MQLAYLLGPGDLPVTFLVFLIAGCHGAAAAIYFVPCLFGQGPEDVDMTGILL